MKKSVLNATSSGSTMSTTTKPPLKKRRLVSTPIVLSTPLAPTAVGVKGFPTAGGIPSCISCYRSLLSAPGGPILCARCSSPTCSICSRTCTASAPSQPPTPHLSFTPSPSPSPTPQSPIPLRPVLGIRTANTNHDAQGLLLPPNADGHRAFQRPDSPVDLVMSHLDQNSNRSPQSPRVGRRRKVSDGDDDSKQNYPFEHGSESGYGPGCGRTLCRNCCVENISSNATTCYDCYGSC